MSHFCLFCLFAFLCFCLPFNQVMSPHCCSVMVAFSCPSGSIPVSDSVGAFRNLMEDNDSDFADVTLAYEDGHQLEAHKVILDGSKPPNNQPIGLK